MHIYFKFLLFFVFLVASPGFAAEIQQVRFGVQDGKTRVVLETTKNPMQKIVPLKDKTGLAIDVKGKWGSQATVLPVKGLVHNVKHQTAGSGVHRIELHTNTPIALDRHFFLPGADGKNGRLVFDFKVAGAPVLPQKDYAGLLNKATNPTIATPIPPTKLKKVATKKAAIFHKPIVVIDPGHGGKDPGAIGTNGTYEKLLTLKMSKELASALNRTGRYKAVLTRNNDTFIALRERVNIARRNKADLFISVHADSLPKASRHVSGATIYTLSENASDKESAMLARRENKSDVIGGVNLKYEDNEVSSILIDLVQRETMNLSAKYANLAIDSLSKRINVKSHAHRFAGFAVLKGVDTPSILLEMGYLSNAQEEWKMNQASYRRKIASGLVESVDKFFRQQIALNSKR